MGLQERPGVVFKVNRGVWVKMIGISRIETNATHRGFMFGHTQQTAGGGGDTSSLPSMRVMYVQFNREWSGPQR